MARVVQRLQQRQGLHPTINARAADGYVRQLPNIVGRPDMKGGAWTQLASALSTIEPKLNRFLEGKHEEWKSDQLTEGVALFQKNRMDWKQFTEANPDMAGANPHLQRGYTLAWLQNKGLDFEADLNGWWEQQRNQIDPNDASTVNQGMNDFARKWMDEQFGEMGLDDALIAEGLQKPMNQAFNSVLSRHNQWRMTENIERAKVELGGFVTRTADKYGISGDWETSGGIVQSARGLATEIQTQLDEMIANGLSATDANRLVVDELASVARDQDNPDILKALDYITTARDAEGKPIATLGGGGYGAQVREKVESLIENEQMRKWDFERRQEAHVRSEQARIAVGNLQAKMLANPAQDFTQDPEYHALVRLDPAKARTMLGFQDKVIAAKSAKFVETEESLQRTADLRLRMTKFEATPDEIREGLLKDFDMPTFNTLMDDYDSIMRYENQLRDSTVRKVGGDIGRAIRGSDTTNITPKADYRAIEAQNYFNDRLLTWMEEYEASHDGNKPPSRAVRLKAYDLQEEILKMDRFTIEDSVGDVQPIQSPANIHAEESREAFIAAHQLYTNGDHTEMLSLAEQAGYTGVEQFIYDKIKELGLDRYVQVVYE